MPKADCIAKYWTITICMPAGLVALAIYIWTREVSSFSPVQITDYSNWSISESLRTKVRALSGFQDGL
jgi:hypothetical protein